MVKHENESWGTGSREYRADQPLVEYFIAFGTELQCFLKVGADLKLIKYKSEFL